ncbi:GNAT family N-acetyltransferase [Candidatus Chloroploca sp. Khr17]|uniref:GNAT family N-acetyltransferase n=1 Tax=Candidatus Chloroploca sp. Khr17 TaxID=2496869 RepID=UPI00101C192E|nr:GNAT family N-acetyltransferase [Candidatus Chloroploca sp. Khr17]
MKITIRPFRYDEADYEAFVTIRNAVYLDYPHSVAEWRRWDDKREERMNFRRFIAEADGQPVASAFFEHVPWMYHPQKFFVNLFVHPMHRGQTVGTQLYHHLLNELAPYEPVMLRHTLREDQAEGMRFAQRYGFVEEMRAWESRLDVASFDPTRFAGAEERVLNQGLTITTAEDLLARDPQFWQKLYAFDCEASVDVPMPEPYTAPPFEVWVRHFEDNPSFIPEAYFVAVDGDIYTGSSALWRRDQSADLETGFTGVLRAYRRRGIALALKLRAVAYAKQVGTPVIRTDNESSNRPMLSINEAMGFVKQPAWVTLCKQMQSA